MAIVLLWASQLSAGTNEWQVFFSPKGGCEQALIKEVERARKSIKVMVYFFTDSDVAESLIKASKRGVEVEVVLDKSQVNSKWPTQLGILTNSNVRVFIDWKHPIMHNKVMIVDEKRVLIGSYNYTSSANERNAENLLVIRNSALARRYLENWKVHKEHSKVP